MSKILGSVTMLTLWGFVGMETATTPAEAVHNPSKTIPKAIILGTLSVVAIYILSSIAIIGLIPTHILMKSNAPYADAAQILFGGNWQVLICIIATIICLGTLNSWILTSGQILLGLANDGFVPKKLGLCNKLGAPYVGILLSSSGIIPLLFLVMNDDIASQIRQVIDVSVTAFLFVYLICGISFLTFLFKQRNYSIASWVIGILANLFCLWVLYETSSTVIASAFLFVLSGTPMYFLWYKKRHLNKINVH
jgi:APA family basic amino acid/polyamine antiporter